MKLFGSVVSPKPPSGPKKVRTRFQTMPVLASQVEDAKEMNEKKSLESEKKLNCSLPIDAASRSRSSNAENDSDDDDNKVLSVKDRLNKINNLVKKNASTSNIHDEENKVKRELGVPFFIFKCLCSFGKGLLCLYVIVGSTYLYVKHIICKVYLYAQYLQSILSNIMYLIIKYSLLDISSLLI